MCLLIFYIFAVGLGLAVILFVVKYFTCKFTSLTTGHSGRIGDRGTVGGSVKPSVTVSEL